MGDKDATEQYYTTVCRTCLQGNGEMQNLSDLISDNYGIGKRQVTYMECLRYCMPVQEMGFEMPKMICKECASALQVAYWFTKNACKAQELLKVRFRDLQEKKRQIERQAFAEALKKPKRYRCKICNAKLETKRSLKDHVKLHLDIIVYSCQMCAYENHKRNYLIEHYQLAHGVEASLDLLKPRTKTTSNTYSNTSSAPAAPSNINHQQILEETQQVQQTNNTYNISYAQEMLDGYASTTPSQHNSEFMFSNTDSNITTSLALPLEGGNNTGTTTIFTQPNGEPITFNTIDGSEINVQNDLNVGNEFIVLADGTVQDAMGRGVVILQSVEDGTLAVQNGLVLENLIQVPNAEAAHIVMAHNEVVQMDVDDLIVEEPQNSPEQDVPPAVDEDMIPATIIKKVSCKICAKDFETQGELKNHMLTHSDIPHFFCDRCPFYTFFKIDLHQHYKSKHNLQPTNKQLQPKNRQRAVSSSFYSDAESPRKNVVVQRIERFPKCPRNVYYCDICFYECDLKYEIKKHYSTKHKIQVTEVHQRISKTLNETVQIQPKTVEIQTEESVPPDYPNGLNCRKCNEVFYYRTELYEHYKLHNAEETAQKKLLQEQNKERQEQQQQQQLVQKQLQQQQLVQKQQQQQLLLEQQQQQLLQQQQQQQQQTDIVTNAEEPSIEVTQETVEYQQESARELQHSESQQTQEESQEATQEAQEATVETQQHQQMDLHQPETELNSQTQYKQQHHETTTIPTSSIDNNLPNFDNVDTMSSLGFNQNQNINNPAPLTPSSSSTYTLPSDAIPQIVEMEQTIETDMDFDFNGDALFEDFDDVDVENESDDNDLRNIVLTSDDDYDDVSKNQAQDEGLRQAVDEVKAATATAPTHSFCAQCQKTFLSHYQFENHMFLHRGLAPYRCEMCTNLYNTKRALIRHYKAIHKKIPTRDMIQAKGDKVYIYDKTPMDYLSIEESKSITLMCAKCTYESIDFASVQLHLNTNHSIHEDTYILKKLPFECPRCIRSFGSKAKLLRHLECNHSTTPINLHQVQMNSSNTATTTTTTTTAPSLNNNVNMTMQMNAESDQDQQEFFNNTITIDSDNNGSDSIKKNCLAADVMNEEQKSNVLNAYSATTNQQSPNINIEDFNTQPTHNIEDLELTQSYDSSLNQIEETNISSCELLKNEDQQSGTLNANLITDTAAAAKQIVLYKCQLCHCTFSTLESVVVHGKSGLKCSTLHKLSKKEKPLFKCELCQCKYKTLNLLIVHLKRHIARKYRCSHCPKTYVSQIELDNHERCHRDERPHKCDLCSNSFRYVHHLKRHKDIIHFGKRHTCPETNCNRQFTTLDQLKIHKWLHYGIVPYKCTYCERFFKKRFLLRDHCLKSHNIRLTENEVAEVFRNNLGYSSPHDMTVAAGNGNMLRRDEWESLPYALR